MTFHKSLKSNRTDIAGDINDFDIRLLKIVTRILYYKNIKGTLSGLRQFLATEKPLKMMKRAFYFTLKALFVLKIFTFCIDFLIRYENGLIRNTRLISKFMMSQTGKQTISGEYLNK